MSFSDAMRARVAPLYESMSPYDPCHDLFHVERVVRNARLLARLEGADEEVCAAAAYLHDLDRAGSKDTLADARAHLAAIGAPEPFAARVLEAVERHKDKSFAPGGKKPMSTEAAVVGDADKLDAIGAIGIARAFSFGGLKGRPLWDGTDTTPAEVYVSGRMGTTVQHFFDKLLRLQDDFNTASGRRLGRERTEFLRLYLDRFFAEWRASGEPAAPAK
ncbi:MAG TPA: HD domain-containing protein [Candidatus Thermoplasmatota archaeon]|nr:HD domain-containing protein [Candidatus Thermoplasmatota archaeon]